LNPFTPFGDGSLIRMANLYANVCQVNNPGDMRACFDMFTQRSANLLRLDDYGVSVGNSADLVVLNCERPEAAIAENIAPIYGFKRGRRTFTRQSAQLHRPSGS
jgi:cytosine/creatinine deaminase